MWPLTVLSSPVPCYRPQFDLEDSLSYRACSVPLKRVDHLLSDSDTMTVPEYQAFPEGNPAKDWETAPLHMCSKKRMDFIAKELYKIPETAKLTKDPLYRAIFDHMLTEQECATCVAACRPDIHPFLPIEDPPPNLRNSGRMSPSSFVRLNDSSSDTNLGASGSGSASNTPLFEGQPGHQRSIAVLETLQSRVNAGAIIHGVVEDTFATDFDMEQSLQDEEDRIQAEIDKEAQEHAKRREAEKHKAKKKADSSASFELRRKALEDRLRAKAKETQSSLETAHRAEVQPKLPTLICPIRSWSRA